jgi:hypothetical protein
MKGVFGGHWGGFSGFSWFFGFFFVISLEGRSRLQGFDSPQDDSLGCSRLKGLDSP